MALPLDSPNATDIAGSSSSDDTDIPQSSTSTDFETGDCTTTSAAELYQAILRRELAGVEQAWKEEHASLLEQLARKDEMIWKLATSVPQIGSMVHQCSVDASQLAHGRPPRLGNRERPEPVPAFALREAGAVVLTPPKRVLKQRQAAANMAVRPSWNTGHAGGVKMSKAPLNKPQKAMFQQNLKAAGTKAPAKKLKPTTPASGSKKSPSKGKPKHHA